MSVNKKVLVAIDHDLLFLERFKRQMDDVGVTSELSVDTIELRASTTKEAIDQAGNGVGDVLRSGLEIEAILVDIVIVESEEGPLDPVCL